MFYQFWKINYLWKINCKFVIVPNKYDDETINKEYLVQILNTHMDKFERFKQEYYWRKLENQVL